MTLQFSSNARFGHLLLLCTPLSIPVLAHAEVQITQSNRVVTANGLVNGCQKGNGDIQVDNPAPHQNDALAGSFWGNRFVSLSDDNDNGVIVWSYQESTIQARRFTADIGVQAASGTNPDCPFGTQASGIGSSMIHATVTAQTTQHVRVSMKYSLNRTGDVHSMLRLRLTSQAGEHAFDHVWSFDAAARIFEADITIEPGTYQLLLQVEGSTFASEPTNVIIADANCEITFNELVVTPFQFAGTVNATSTLSTFNGKILHETDSDFTDNPGPQDDPAQIQAMAQLGSGGQYSSARSYQRTILEASGFLTDWGCRIDTTDPAFDPNATTTVQGESHMAYNVSAPVDVTATIDFVGAISPWLEPGEEAYGAEMTLVDYLGAEQIGQLSLVIEPGQRHAEATFRAWPGVIVASTNAAGILRSARIDGIDMRFSFVEASQPHDVNIDGFIDGQDLAIILGNWGVGGAGDFNGDFIVDGQDLALFLGSWGR